MPLNVTLTARDLFWICNAARLTADRNPSGYPRTLACIAVVEGLEISSPLDEIQLVNTAGNVPQHSIQNPQEEPDPMPSISYPANFQGRAMSTAPLSRIGKAYARSLMLAQRTAGITTPDRLPSNTTELQAQESRLNGYATDAVMTQLKNLRTELGAL